MVLVAVNGCCHRGWWTLVARRVVSVSCGFRATSVMSGDGGDGESNRSTTATASYSYNTVVFDEI